MLSHSAFLSVNESHCCSLRMRPSIFIGGSPSRNTEVQTSRRILSVRTQFWSESLCPSHTACSVALALGSTLGFFFLITRLRLKRSCTHLYGAFGARMTEDLERAAQTSVDEPEICHTASQDAQQTVEKLDCFVCVIRLEFVGIRRHTRFV